MTAKWKKIATVFKVNELRSEPIKREIAAHQSSDTQIDNKHQQRPLSVSETEVHTANQQTENTPHRSSAIQIDHEHQQKAQTVFETHSYIENPSYGSLEYVYQYCQTYFIFHLKDQATENLITVVIK